MKSLWKNKMVVLILVLTFISIATPAYATPQIVTGTTNLFKSATTWLLVLIPVGAGLALAWCKFKQMMSDNDPSVVAHYNKWMKNIVISAVIATTASGIIRTVLAFY